MAYVKQTWVDGEEGDTPLSAARLNYIEDGVGAAAATADAAQPAGDYATSTELTDGLATKANTPHAHTVADTTGLQAALDGKATTGHTHDDRYYTETEVDTALAGKADTASHARLENSTAQSVPNGTHTALAFNTEVIDDGGYHDTATNNTRITIPTTGRYELQGQAEIAANGTGGRLIMIRLNGAARIGQQFFEAPTGQLRAQVTTGPYQFTAGDYLEFTVWQDSGGALDVTGGSPTWFALKRLF